MSNFVGIIHLISDTVVNIKKYKSIRCFHIEKSPNTKGNINDR